MRSKGNAKPPAGEAGFPAPALSQAVKQCRLNRGFLAALERIYALADAEIAKIGGTCRCCGACCDFGVTDHRLYLTTGELALLTASRPPSLAACKRGPCPYQVGRQCGARMGRSLGCRTFFCDPAAADARRACYETYHRQIRLLHQRRWVPYAYAELTEAVLQLFSGK